MSMPLSAVIDHSEKRRQLQKLADMAVEPLSRQAYGGHNLKFRLMTPEGQKWFVKYCRNDNNLLSDICEREALAGLLGEIVQVRIVPAFVISRQIQSNECRGNIPALIRDKCVLMPFLNGDNLEARNESTERIMCTQMREIAGLLAATFWLGDDDRGVSDVVFADGAVHFVDNGLTGPRRGSRLRGAHPFDGAFREQNRIKRCYEGKPSFVMRLLRDMQTDPQQLSEPDVIGRIEQLSDADIADIVTISGVDSWAIDPLIQRRGNLRAEYAHWLQSASNLVRGV